MNTQLEAQGTSIERTGSRVVTKLTLAGSALVLGFGLAACGGSSDSSTSTPEQSPPVSVDINGNNVVSGALPTGWPTDVPQPPNTTVVGGAGGEGTFSAGFNGTGSLASELDTYFGELKSNGWTQDKRVDTGKNLTGWDKGNRRTQVIAQDNGDGTYSINVTIVAMNS